MITAKLNGGLGNQMFQVAAAESLAIDNKTYIAFDLHNEVVMQGNSAYYYKKNIFNKLDELPNNWIPNTIFSEQSPTYSPIPFSDNMAIAGYFQSEKYFINNKEYIIDLFSHDETIKRLAKKYNNILSNSVSVHIRRGDYVEIGNARDLEYFYRALNRLWSIAYLKNILIFSDDIKWCKENFGYTAYDNIHYIEGQEDYEDMYLMSLCNHNITDMSSFSWWSAYLNKNPFKRVFMPCSLSEGHTSDFYFCNTIKV